jgi:hypothetical protein
MAPLAGIIRESGTRYKRVAARAASAGASITLRRAPAISSHAALATRHCPE